MHELWQKIGLSASIVFVAIALWCLWLWQPERQVRLHQDHLLDAAERRSWTRFSSFIAADYSDRWGHDKEFVVRETAEILRQFFALGIMRDYAGLDVDADRAEVQVRLKLEGNGTPLAQFAQAEVNALSEPFVFAWQKKSWRPWDWQLSRADQSQLRGRW